MKHGFFGLVVVAATIAVLGFAGGAAAIELGDMLSIEGDLAAAYQYQSLSRAPDHDNKGRGALVFQPTLRLQLTEKDVIQAGFGFAAGNALNDGHSPFALVPWAADLEGDVKGIGGRDRDYLLTAWYARRLALGAFGDLEVVGGLINAADYLDDNAFANDEFGQFMNEALVNSPTVFLPAFDLGGALQYELGNWHARAVVMDVAGDEEDAGHHFYGAQIGYRLDLGLGEGNYRLAVAGTGKKFDGPDSEADQALLGGVLSFDQELGDTYGVWLRLGHQDNDALIAHRNLYAAGIDIKGGLWGRGEDNIGFGYALLDGGNDDIDRSQVAELYYRWVFNEYSAVSLNFQYQEDEDNDGNKPRGLISGVRFVASF
ncbi:carbohydrate porin [Desulfatitalea alkaliphila]|uniref:Carbohydrate porin n=1 Tax=Desulfatitalea alkaliphila TaxID=2929485 RepID=A0AA41R3Z1_9BACT|nr:carbohydrate porin [Desulfatitalea alkaliphila]MCJ8502832.1 carbohydrate porin [Desulfatitalea alkaliphila]